MKSRPFEIALVIATALAPASAFAHIRVSPPGRMGTNDAVKFIQNNKSNPALAPDSPGPCSTFTTRMASPLNLTGGQSFTFTIQETINHPGRFYVQFRANANEEYWAPANQLALISDNQNNGVTQAVITVPNLTTAEGTFRVLQEMDDQPGEFYVHCIDANISLAGGPTPPGGGPSPGPDGDNTFSSTSMDVKKPAMAGCGLVSADGGPSGPNRAVILAALLLAPLLSVFAHRRRSS